MKLMSNIIGEGVYEHIFSAYPFGICLTNQDFIMNSDISDHFFSTEYYYSNEKLSF